MTGTEILKKYEAKWDKLLCGRSYYDTPITIRQSFFTHACMEIELDVKDYILQHSYCDAIEILGEPICRFIQFGKEPEEF